MNKRYQEPAVQDIADAIREKNGTSDTYKIAEMGSAIRAIPSGGGTGSTFDELASGIIVNAHSSTLTIIGDRAFNGASDLETVDFPNAISIGTASFLDTKLTSVTFPKVIVVGVSSFARSQHLIEADFAVATNIDNYAFNSATLFERLILRASSVATLGFEALYLTKIANGAGYIYVPDNLVSSYKTAANWSTYASQIKPISELEE